MDGRPGPTAPFVPGSDNLAWLKRKRPESDLTRTRLEYCSPRAKGILIEPPHPIFNCETAKSQHDHRKTQEQRDRGDDLEQTAANDRE